MLAEIVRLDRAHHRPIAGDSPEVEGLKPVARSHQAFIWDRTRHFQRLRSALREFFLDQNPLRRGHRLAHFDDSRGLTSQAMGCLKRTSLQGPSLRLV